MVCPQQRPHIRSQMAAASPADSGNANRRKPSGQRCLTSTRRCVATTAALPARGPRISAPRSRRLGLLGLRLRLRAGPLRARGELPAERGISRLPDQDRKGNGRAAGGSTVGSGRGHGAVGAAVAVGARHAENFHETAGVLHARRRRLLHRAGAGGVRPRQALLQAHVRQAGLRFQSGLVDLREPLLLPLGLLQRDAPGSLCPTLPRAPVAPADEDRPAQTAEACDTQAHKAVERDERGCVAIER
mmetsp:Transcript_85043/g.219068  ORF Transcript_85043/g.219068 Transcript_85043/m.219068 type:complete len:245 (+) Transcript_85043:103-837(+)